MSNLAIIPARYASTRFPGKPLVSIGGRPMIQWVYERTAEASLLDEVVVATDDERIREACSAFGARVFMTSPDHPTGTDRLAEVAARVDHEIIVNVQGDEPLIEPFVVDGAIEALRSDETAVMSTVVHPADPDALDDPNRVKVVLDRNGFALYFSRSPIPYARAARKEPPLQHVGLYCYRRTFLADLVSLPRTPAEQCEELEQLRVLEHGYRIRAAKVDGWHSIPVDVPEDVARVEAQMRKIGLLA